MELHYENKLIFNVAHSFTPQEIFHLLPLQASDFYLISNGKLVSNDDVPLEGKVHLVLRCLGGKGGFGSMLRAIGAQMQKTTNRGSCRDLSGRRLRDISEEQRLKKWIGQQVEREKETADKKQKLERLMEQPKHEFRDAEYDRLRSELPEKVEDAVLQGLQVLCGHKRKSEEGKQSMKLKRPKLWHDIDEDLSGSDLDDDDDCNQE